MATTTSSKSDSNASAFEDCEKILLLFESALDEENYVVIETLIKSKERNLRFSLNIDESTLLTAKRGNKKVLARLLVLRPRMSYEDSQGKRAIHYAAENGHLECVKLLLQQGAISNCSDSSGYTPLHLACIMGHKHIVRQMVKQCAHVNSCRTELGESAIHMTATRGYTEIMALLLDKGGNVNVTTRQGKGGETPLHKAVIADKPHMVEYLLSQGAQPNISDTQGKQPIHLASERGQLRCLSVLLQHSVSLTAWDSRGLSPLGCAILEDQTAAAKMLIDHCGDLSMHRCRENSLLYMATVKSNLDLMDHLVSAGADVNFHSSTQQPAIFSAVNLGKLDSVKKLISLGADMDITDSRNNTALHMINSRLGGPVVEVVQALLEAGARLDQRDHSQATPLQKYLALGVISGQYSMACVQILCQAGSSLGPDDYRNGKSSPLFWLAYSGCLREALYLARVGWELQTELWILLPGKDDRQNMLHQAMIRIARTVPSLLSCSRKVVRHELSKSRQYREILSSIDSLPIPVPLKNYLLFTDVDPEDVEILSEVPLQDIRPLYIST